MESLNDIIQRYVEINGRLFERKGIVVEIDFDTNMPKIYEDFMTGTPLSKALSQLTLEMEDAKPTRAKYSTQYGGQSQRLMISHNGNPIPQGDLAYLNEFLRDIADGKREWSYWRHGNLIAGQAIKEWDGRILLENIDESGYRVRTTMEVPVKAISK